jgi:hypothetical protein
VSPLTKTEEKSFMQQGSLLSIPPQKVSVHRFTMSNLEANGVERGIWHAITIEHNRYIKCHVLFEAGFHYSDIPLRSIATITPFLDRENRLKDFQLQPYECLSDRAEIVVLKVLENMEVKTKYEKEAGLYRFSVHFLGRETWMNLPEQRKILHCIETYGGQFAFLPNNYLLWLDEAATSENPEWPTWLRANEHE